MEFRGSFARSADIATEISFAWDVDEEFHR
jgi:hypothetical protein